MPRNIPVLHVSGRTLAEAYEKALIELNANGTRFKTQYDKPEDPMSIDATMDITVEDPLADPMIHKAFPGGIEDLREYVMELEGAKDTWTKRIGDPDDTRWEYTYHGRLANYGGFKNKGGVSDSVHKNGASYNQFEHVVSKLCMQPFTRQAQMITWMPCLDLDCYDPPCLQRIWFRVLEDADETWWLNYDVSFRSNDAWGAYMMNSFGLTMMVKELIADEIARRTGKTVKLGRMNWKADSWHVYGKDIASLRARLLDRIPITSFEDRTYCFSDPMIQEIYNECEPAILAKIAEQEAKMMSDILFAPWKLGKMEVRNRVVMAPMTRSRCPGNSPGETVATYYSQRAEAGLIVTEGTSPSPNGLGYARIPGLFSPRQVQDWSKVTNAVHRAGGRIFVQLMHTGRVSHPLNMPAGSRILAPSPIALSGKMWTDAQGEQPYPAPEEMTEADIQATLAEYLHSAALAIEAGFDGVELHGANGYLIDQFLNTASNRRTDAWGGSIENRIRFAVEVARQAAAKIGKDRVGMRLSPYGVFNGMAIDPTIEDTFERLTAELDRMGLVYIHLVDHSSMGAPEVKPSIKRKIRAAFRDTLILSGGYDSARAVTDLVAKQGDLIAFGRPFISNPKLVTQLRNGSVLLPADQSTFYTPGEKGYTDYPV